MVDLIIPDYIDGIRPKTIAENGFNACLPIRSVIISDFVINIYKGAFMDCYSISSVKIGNSVTSIGIAAFYTCTSLTSIEIPNSVREIGYLAFGVNDGEDQVMEAINIYNSPNSINGSPWGAYNAQVHWLR